MSRKYTYTPKREKEDIRKADLDKWITILNLKTKKHLTDKQIGEELGLTQQRISRIRQQIGDRTVADMIKLKEETKGGK